MTSSHNNQILCVLHNTFFYSKYCTGMAKVNRIFLSLSVELKDKFFPTKINNFLSEAYRIIHSR